MLAIHLIVLLNRVELTDSRLLGFMTANTCSKYLMTSELQSTFGASVIKCPALKNNIPYMVNVKHLPSGAFLSSVSVKRRTKSWEAHERNQQFGENESIDIGKSQTL